MSRKSYKHSGEFAIEGYFGIPGQAFPDDFCPGRLTFSPSDGVKLRTLGRIKHNQAAKRSSFHLAQELVLHGFGTDGERITLFRCHYAEAPSYPGINIEDYNIDIALIGEYFEDALSEIFDICSFSFDNIEQWTEHRYLHPLIEEDKFRGLQEIRPNVRAYPCGETIGRVELSYSANLDFDSVDGNTATIITEMRLVSSQRRNVRWFVEQAERLRHLAVACCGEQLASRYLSLSTGAQRLEIDVIYAGVGARSSKYAPERFPLIPFPALHSCNPNILEDWLRCYDHIESAMALLIAVLGPDVRYEQVAFLLAMQAIEAFDKLTSDVHLVEEADFERYISQLSAAIPPDMPPRLQDKIRGSLQYYNEPSLRHRFRNIIQSLESAFGIRPLGIDKEYIQRLLDTRNYYTHFTKELKKRTLDLHGVAIANMRLKLLLLVLVLRATNIPETIIHNAIAQNARFSRYLT